MPKKEDAATEEVPYFGTTQTFADVTAHEQSLVAAQLETIKKPGAKNPSFSEDELNKAKTNDTAAPAS